MATAIALLIAYANSLKKTGAAPAERVLVWTVSS